MEDSHRASRLITLGNKRSCQHYNMTPLEKKGARSYMEDLLLSPKYDRKSLFLSATPDYPTMDYGYSIMKNERHIEGLIQVNRKEKYQLMIPSAPLPNILNSSKNKLLHVHLSFNSSNIFNSSLITIFYEVHIEADLFPHVLENFLSYTHQIEQREH